MLARYRSQRLLRNILRVQLHRPASCLRRSNAQQRTQELITQSRVDNAHFLDLLEQLDRQLIREELLMRQTDVGTHGLLAKA